MTLCYFGYNVNPLKLKLYYRTSDLMLNDQFFKCLCLKFGLFLNIHIRKCIGPLEYFGVGGITQNEVILTH